MKLYISWADGTEDQFNTVYPPETNTTNHYLYFAIEVEDSRFPGKCLRREYKAPLCNIKYWYTTS